MSQVVVGSGRLCREVERLLRMELIRYIPEVLCNRLAVACDRSRSMRFNPQLVIDMWPHSAADGVAHVIFGCHMLDAAIQTHLERSR